MVRAGSVTSASNPSFPEPGRFSGSAPDKMTPESCARAANFIDQHAAVTDLRLPTDGLNCRDSVAMTE